METQQKVVRVLYLILFAFLAVALRVLNLTTVHREERIRDAKRPKERSLLLKAERGSIVDRFGTPLAMNKISYNAAVYYSQILEIPSISWEMGASGKKERVFSRKNYIESLSKTLGSLLDMDPLRIEDLIHAKASLFPHIPFTIKKDLSEKSYYRLKALEKDWPGLYAEIGLKRHYPLGKTACHLIGTMGAISSKEYNLLARKLRELKQTVDLYERGFEPPLPKPFHSFKEVYERLESLKEKSYSMSDLIGKTGIEGQFEEKLRGYFGRKNFEVDQKGRFVKETLGSRTPLAGEQIVLTISAELQEFAEKLLIDAEALRKNKSIRKDPVHKTVKRQKEPWIKGGAIVAMDPKNGEILAMASYPRFDPEDFALAKTANVHKWLEDETYIGELWDGRANLSKETGEEVRLSWELFLDWILPKESSLLTFFQKMSTVKGAIELQEDFDSALYFSKEEPLALLEKLKKNPSQFVENRELFPYLKKIQNKLSLIENPKDQLFAIDLCRAVINAPRFSDRLLKELGPLTISAYLRYAQIFLSLEEEKKEIERQAFAKEFILWRKVNQKEFLLEKRAEEKRNKLYSKPYLDYLDQKEKELFQEFWNEQKYSLLQKAIWEKKETLTQLQHFLKTLNVEVQEDFLRTVEPFSENVKPLYTSWKTGKKLLASFYPKEKFGFLRSYAFQSSSPLGSLFKLVTAYEGLRQNVSSFTILDEFRRYKGQQIVARSLSGEPYPRIYKGGRLPKSSSSSVGKIDLVRALERSSNPFFSILAGDFLQAPDDLKRAALAFGLGQKTGIPLPLEAKGNVPTDLESNRAGLYSFAIGQHTLLSTPLQAAAMLSAIANGGVLWKPKITLRREGASPKRGYLEAFSFEKALLKEELKSVGIYFPLFTKYSSFSPSDIVEEEHKEKVRTLDLPSSIQKELFEGMDRSLWGERGSARPIAIRLFLERPEFMADHLALKHQMIGKTSTSQITYNPNINPTSQAEIYKDLWFGGISFPKAFAFEDPEIVVIVLLRFGDSGKEAAPFASKVIQKWREINASRKQSVSRLSSLAK